MATATETPTTTETTETKPAETTPASEKTADTKAAETTDTKAAETSTERRPAGGTSMVTKAGTPAEGSDATAETDGQQDGGQGAAQGAPDKYELTLPEGGFVDDATLKDFELLAREANLTNEAAQAALEHHADRVAAQAARFEVETKADPTYGGEKLEATLELVSKALNTFRPAGTPRGDALRRLLDTTGYGNNLEIVSLLADIGKRMADDTVPGAGGRSSDSGSSQSRIEKFYGKG